MTPDTILRWYRKLVAQKFDGSHRRHPGRPRTKVDIVALTVRMANENPTWGYTRIRGGLKSLGHDVARDTIKAILADHGIAPAPERGTTTRWKTFLAAHWDALAAADFFTVEVLTFGGLVRYAVFFVTKLKTRTGEIAGITCEPDEAWMTQVARKLTDARDGFLHGVITWGRLVSAVVTQLARAGAPGVPSRVFYTSIPVEAMRAMNPDREPPPFLAPQASHSTVRVPFKEADLDATRRSMSCHKTQFPDALIERMTGGMGKIFKGELPLSPMVPSLRAAGQRADHGRWGVFRFPLGSLPLSHPSALQTFCPVSRLCAGQHVYKEPRNVAGAVRPYLAAFHCRAAQVQRKWVAVLAGESRSRPIRAADARRSGLRAT